MENLKEIAIIGKVDWNLPPEIPLYERYLSVDTRYVGMRKHTHLYYRLFGTALVELNRQRRDELVRRKISNE